MTITRLDWTIGPDDTVCKIDSDVFTRRFFIWPEHRMERLERHYISISARERTRTLLISLTAGSGFWKSQVRDCILGGKPNTVPSIAFDRPATDTQIHEYWRWLTKMVGSTNRFRDGWGHQVKLVIDMKFSPPILIASSAGPDGKWNTNDDMILRRNTKTGKIIEQIGFAN